MNNNKMVWSIVAKVAMVGGAILSVVGGTANAAITKIQIQEEVVKAVGAVTKAATKAV